APSRPPGPALKYDRMVAASTRRLPWTSILACAYALWLARTTTGAAPTMLHRTSPKAPSPRISRRPNLTPIPPSNPPIPDSPNRQDPRLYSDLAVAQTNLSALSSFAAKPLPIHNIPPQNHTVGMTRNHDLGHSEANRPMSL